MKKQLKYAVAALAGGAYGLIAVLLSNLLLRNAGSLFRIIGTAAGVTETEHIAQVLAQLRTAAIVSPWIAVLAITMAAGVLFFWLVQRCKRKTLFSCLVWIPLLLPVVIAVTLFTEVNGIRPSAAFTGASESASYQTQTYASTGENWYFGFGRWQILPDENSDQPLYIAGYNSGVEITGVLDYCEARAVWIDTGEDGILLIGIDCIALDSGTVATIRDNLSDIPNCASVNVYSTHSHASIDTLGLWGPLAVDGKNDAYMNSLIQAATEAGREAAADRKAGQLYFAQVEAVDMFRDSREPWVVDTRLYQLRFAAKDGGSGLRMFFLGAHPESLRGSNTLLSRDFPGILCDDVTEATGDNTMFFPGAIGGLVMTKEFADSNIDAQKNLEITAEKLVAYALSITEKAEEQILPDMAFGREKMVVPMDNTVFWVCKYLGILNSTSVLADSATGYGVETELSVLMLDDIAVTLLPGEIFPELVYGTLYAYASPQNENPAPLSQIAAQCGVEKILIVGLANDEIGYIVPPSDYLVNEDMPYFKRTTDYRGEDHYEETNSVGPECANVIADTFASVIEELLS